ncbi:MAG: acetyl ornithine aminotransferase family protein [Pseudomonadota bacterium]|jgi:4-aminobutyrate aminotransferase|nr:acetyl ornithine aminotransferase family protein [Pseudomonadota bacterium]
MSAISIKTALPGPKASAIIEQDHTYLSTSRYRMYPFVLARGEGCYVEDVDGNMFMDLHSGIAVTSTGHNHPEVNAAIAAQATRYLHNCGNVFYNDSQGAYAQKLAEATPIYKSDKNRVFFCNTGAEAWDGALKLARYATGRQNVICFYNGFHGRTFGGISSNSSKVVQRRGFGPLLPGIHFAYFPRNFPCPSNPPYPTETEGCLEYIKDVLFKKVVAPDEVAAIALEPVQGEGGYVVPPKEFVEGLRQICDEYGILLIADEVQSGMGRTGKLYAMEHFGVQADIVTTAKGIASGMPIAAFVASDKVMTWPEGAHGSTYGGNPVAVAAASKTLDLLQGGLTAHAADVGAYFMDKLKALQSKHADSIGDVRGLGLMIGMEFTKVENGRIVADAAKRDAFIQKAFEKGLLTLACGNSTVRFCPPLVISKSDIDIAYDIISDVVSAL